MKVTIALTQFLAATRRLNSGRVDGLLRSVAAGSVKAYNLHGRTGDTMASLNTVALAMLPCALAVVTVVEEVVPRCWHRWLIPRSIVGSVRAKPNLNRLCSA